MLERKRLIFPILVFLCLGMLGTFLLLRQEVEVRTIDIKRGGNSGMSAHDFYLENHKAEKISLKTLKGIPLLLHFWASWCAPCLKEIPDIIGLAERISDKKLRIILISLDDRWEDAYKILSPKGLPKNVEYVLDPKQKSSEDYGSYQFPETFLIDQNHMIVTKWIGAQKWNTKEAVEILSPYF